MVGTLQVKEGNPAKSMTWDTDNPETVEQVRVEFDRIVNGAKGLAYAIDGGGTATIVKDFDPEAAPVVVLMPQHVGG